MNDIDNNKHFLHLLHKTHLFQKRALIDTASLAQINILCEIILNIITGIVELDTELKEKFKRKRALLWTILKRSTSKKRKQLLLKKNIKLLDSFIEISLNILEGNE